MTTLDPIRARVRARAGYRDFFPLTNPDPTPDPTTVLAAEVRHLRGTLEVEALRNRTPAQASYQTRDGGSRDEWHAVALRLFDGDQQAATQWVRQHGH